MTGTDDRLDEIEARADAATPGPWEAHELEAAEYCVLRVSEGDDDYGDDVCSAGSMTDAQFIAAAREDVPWLIGQLRDAREGKPFQLCDKCLSDLDAPMCEDCYRRSGPLVAANSARDAAIAQLAEAKAELRDARAEVERLHAVDFVHQGCAELRRKDNEYLIGKRDSLRAELAAERAKVERVEALCDEYRTNCDPDTKQAQVAEIFRAALAGGEQGE